MQSEEKIQRNKDMSKMSVEIAEARGKNRSKIVAIASRGSLPDEVSKLVNVDDETLLDDVRRAAKDSLNAQNTLTESVRACCDADIDRSEVVQAIIEAGYAESTARSIVCVVYGQAGKGVKAKGQGREVSPAAVAFAELALGKCDSAKTAIKMLRAACRHLEREAKRSEAKAVRERAAQASKANAAKAPVQTAGATAIPVAIVAA